MERMERLERTTSSYRRSSMTSNVDIPLSPQDRRAAFEEVKALRARRIAEKAELQDLNTRLEIVLNHLDSRDRRIADLIAERDELQNELNSRSNRWQKMLEEASTKWTSDAMRTKAESRELAESVNNLRTENDRLKSELESSRANLKRLQAMLPELDSLKTQLQAREEKYELQLVQLKERLGEREKALRDREEKSLAREAKLKEELEAQRLQDIKAVEDRCELDREAQIEKFRLDWNRQIAEKDRMLEQLKGECAGLREELSSRNKELKQLQKQLRDMMQRHDEAERNRDNVRNSNTEEITRLRLEIQEMGNAFARKNLQFDELLEQKILLQQEIEMYRTLVSRAEKAQELLTPPKKRYRADDSIFTSIQQSRMISTRSSSSRSLTGSARRRRTSLFFSGGEVEEGYFELQNPTSEPVSLVGLTLYSAAGSSIPLNKKNDELRPGQTIRVYLREKSNMPSSSLLWTDAWDGHSKTDIRVTNAQGRKLCQLTLDPEMFGDSVDRNNVCFVM